MEKDKTLPLLQLIGANAESDIELAPSTMSELVSANFMVQRVVQEDSIYFRILCKTGLAVVLEKKFLSEKFERVSREYVEMQLRINFNASYPELVWVPEETIH